MMMCLPAIQVVEIPCTVLEKSRQKDFVIYFGLLYLDFWPPDPQSWPFHALSRGPLVPICIEIGLLFFKYFVHKFGNRRLNERTDGRTDKRASSEHNAAATRPWRRHHHHHNHFICSVKCKNTVENKKQENTEQGEPGSYERLRKPLHGPTCAYSLSNHIQWNRRNTHKKTVKTLHKTPKKAREI